MSVCMEVKIQIERKHQVRVVSEEYANGNHVSQIVTHIVTRLPEK